MEKHHQSQYSPIRRCHQYFHLLVGWNIDGAIGIKDNGSTVEAQLMRRKTLTQNIVSINQGKRIQDFYQVHDDHVLGSGISGQVKLCAHIETGRQYALKVLSKKMLRGETLADLKAEINIVASLDHPNIVRIVDPSTAYT